MIVRRHRYMNHQVKQMLTAQWLTTTILRITVNDDYYMKLFHSDT